MFDLQALGVPGESAYAAPLRLVLYPGELLRLPRAKGRIRILTGCAWLTSEGIDLVVRKGRETAFRPWKFPLLLSPYGAETLTLEIYS